MCSSHDIPPSYITVSGVTTTTYNDWPDSAIQSAIRLQERILRRRPATFHSHFYIKQSACHKAMLSINCFSFILPSNGTSPSKTISFLVAVFWCISRTTCSKVNYQTTTNEHVQILSYLISYYVYSNNNRKIYVSWIASSGPMAILRVW